MEKKNCIMEKKNFSIVTIRPYIGSNDKSYLSFNVNGTLKRVGKSVITIILDAEGKILQLTPSIEEILSSEDIIVNRNQVSKDESVEEKF